MKSAAALISVTLALLVTSACDVEGPCDRWADYVCQCHDGEPGFDSCASLRDLALDPSADEELQCEDDLQQQLDDDRENGIECTVDDGADSLF